MDEFTDILLKLEAPLLFSSKDSFKNLSLVKNLETTALTFLDRLKALRHPSPGDAGSVVAALEETFRGFDSFTEAERKTRITRAIRLIEQLKDDACRPSPSPLPDGTATGDNREGAGLLPDVTSLSRSLEHIKGVGPKTALLLAKKGMKTVEDMLYFLPRKYEDRRYVQDIASLRPGERATIMGSIVGAESKGYRHRRIFEVSIDDGSGLLTAKWFRGNSAYLKNTFKKGRKFVFTGEVKMNFFGRDMIHPDFERIEGGGSESVNFGRIVPVYSETEGLHQKYLRKIMAEVVGKYAKDAVSPIPPSILSGNRLLPVDRALRNCHFPGDGEDIEALNRFRSPSQRSLVFDEFFFFEMGMALKRESNIMEQGISFPTGGKLVERFYHILPFDLTAAQKRVIGEIEADMRGESPMNRILQGDVGSGKTAVSMAAMVTACESGHQTAIMAPTEILAAQHYRNIRHWSEALELKTVLLTGSMKSREHGEVLAEIEAGDIDIVIGTHALIQEGVSFKRLGLAVIDEQHRFGVMQRAALRNKGHNPDVLVMTATPIPRTLAMTVYGDLDISVIDEMPPGKRPVATRLFYEKDRRRVYDIVRQELGRGNQAFIVYPLVEESEKMDLKDATTMAAHLQSDIFPDRRVGLIHGKMKNTEKDAVMASFLEQSLDILVATTVIEVGIDIPSASLMIIEHAERFGLSQLHQLRGRVGRGDVPSRCILIAHHQGTGDARKRLRIMEQTTDGFKIAEEDLAIRGPGEFMGIRQSGLPDFRIANVVRDGRILNDARREAFAVIKADPTLSRREHRLLREVLMQRWQGRLELARTG